MKDKITSKQVAIGWWATLDMDQKIISKMSCYNNSKSASMVGKSTPKLTDDEILEIYNHIHEPITINRASFGVSYSEEEVKGLLRQREEFLSNELTDFVLLDDWFELNKKKQN